MRPATMSKDLEPVYCLTNEDELRTLKEEWETGKLNTLSEHLLGFIDRHRTDILKLARNSKSPEKLVEAVRKFVCRRGYIHLPLDMADQIHQINCEVWYQGEKGEKNCQKIKENWTVQHAPNWRRWRIKEILYIIDQRASEVGRRLLS